MKKVLIITYYWPPSGGGGVQRWLKFAKYLPENGWQPIVFTPENPDFNIKDQSLKKDVAADLEVLKFPIWEPFQLFNKIAGKKNSKNIQQGLVLEKKVLGWKDRLFIWIRGNLFIPDPRMFWIRPSSQFLKDYVLSAGIDAIVTTGPPHSMHLIGYHVHKATGIPWLADFRDPWSTWDILPKLKVSKLAFRIHRMLEKKVLTHASAITTVSNTWKKELEVLGNREVDVITNGYDEADFPTMGRAQPDKFRITHAGLLNELRDPLALWEALRELCIEDASFYNDLELRLVGILGEALLSRLQADHILGKILKIDGYLSHKQVLLEYQRAEVLLLILNQSANATGHIPGKLFEYLAVGKPVLTLGPEEGDAAFLIKDSKGGFVCGFDEKDKIKEALTTLYLQFKSDGTHGVTGDTGHLTRRNLTKKLVAILNREGTEK